MNKKVILQKVRHLIKNNSILLVLNAIVLLIIAFGKAGYLSGTNIYVFDYVLLTIIDHYYALYCIFPILFIIIIKYFRQTSDIESIRYPNRLSQQRINLISLAISIILYFLATFIIISIVGLFYFRANLSANIITNPGFDDFIILQTLHKAITPYPLVSILFVIIFYCFGFFVLSCVLSIVHREKGLHATIVTGVLIFILAFIGFQVDAVNIFPFLFFGNYIIFHRSLFINGFPSFILILLTGLGIILYCFCPILIDKKQRWKRSILNEFTISRQTSFISFIILVILFILEILLLQYSEFFNARNIPLSLMAGPGNGEWSFIGWTKVAIIYLLPLFFVGQSLSKIEQYHELPIFIRFKSFANLRWQIIKSYFSFTFAYVMILIATFLLMFLLGSETSSLHKFIVEIIPINFSAGHFAMFLLFFLGNMMFNLTLYLVLSQRLKSITVFILFLAYAFLIGLIPNGFYADFTPGLLRFLTLYNTNLSILGLRFILALILTITYLISLKRRSYVNN